MTTVSPDQLTARLVEWANTHATSVSEEHGQLREEFQTRFPLDTLPDLPLDHYVIGRGDADNFCYWLEWKTGMLGSIRGGTASKFGVYWSQKHQEYVVNAMFKDPEDARSRILGAIAAGARCLERRDFTGLDEATAAMGDARYTMRLKPLSLYFPEHLLPITSPEHLQFFLRLLGQEPTGGQAALNHQLLTFLRSTPGVESYDTVGLMRFLYSEFPPEGLADPPTRQVWKVALGEGSMYLADALKMEAVFIGSRVPDLGAVDPDDMAEALAEVGDERGFASSAVNFAHRIREGDVVLVNRGRRAVAAVGLIDGPYQAPGAPFNPVTPGGVGERFPFWGHARRVRWLLRRELPLPEGVPVLAVKTVSPVAESTLQAVLDVSAARDASAENVARLEELGWTGGHKPVKPVQSEEVRYLVEVASHTRNIVLYGPPGTGKTYTAREFAQAWLGSGRPASPPALPVQAARTWWQVIALTLAEVGEATVTELLEHPEIQAFAEERPGNNSVKNTLWQQLLTHTHPDDGSSNTTRRHKPYVFTKSGAAPDVAVWTLTEEGKAEVARLQPLTPSAAPPLGGEPMVSSLELITFHPAYTYEEFVEGLRPTPGGGFTVRDGAFKRLCKRAHENPDQEFVVVIDEINRADTAKTFGELITLLEDDKRAEPGTPGRYAVTLPYSEERFNVPSNVIVVGTMNTADRSITLMDTALRRRFTFVEVPPRPDLLSGTVEGTALSPARLLATLNVQLAELLDADHRIGHAYLMGPTLGARDLIFRWRHKLVPLLQEYFYARDEQLQALLGRVLYEDATGKTKLGDDALVAALVKLTEDRKGDSADV